MARATGTTGPASPRTQHPHDFATQLLAHLGRALRLCRLAEERAPMPRDRALFAVLGLALRHLSLLVATSRATSAPLTLSLGRQSGDLLRLEVALPAPRPTLPEADAPEA